MGTGPVICSANRNKGEIQLIRKSFDIAVIGLGFVGLPLAVHFAGKGKRVLGIDQDPAKLCLINKGRSYIPDISDATLRQSTRTGRLVVSAPDASVSHASYIVVTVPTPLDERDGKPDLSALKAASRYIAQCLLPGQTVVFESSTYPGTLEEVILPILSGSGLQAGRDFFLGYSPERIDPGNKKHTLQSIPKVISGYTKKCREKVAALYGEMFDRVVPVSTPKVAELCKIFENIQRLVNISLVNEMEQICHRMKIDFREALAAAATKPFGFTPYWPGPGIGGHCIPVDPLYFQWKAEQHGLTSQLINASIEINRGMPQEIVQRVEESCSQDRKNNSLSVLVIGLAYKKDVNDVRESPAINTVQLLADRGHAVTYHDPHVPAVQIGGKEWKSAALTETLLQGADVTVILTDHSHIDWPLVKRCAKRIVDTRGVLKKMSSGEVM